MTALWVIVLCGVLSIVYAIWATMSVLKADAGNPRMQEIAAAVREGAQAYLRRQYATIAIVGVVIFALLAWLLGLLVAVGFAIGAILSAATLSARSRPASPRTTRATPPPSPTTLVTTSVTAPAWRPTCSRPMR